jgi:hypothetical protein
MILDFLDGRNSQITHHPEKEYIEQLQEDRPKVTCVSDFFAYRL